MTDDEIRQLVRGAIARHLGGASSRVPSVPSAPVSAVPISFARYPIARSVDDVMCIIEPAARCNQCGFCQCHGL
jgi:hypothetical protein